MPFDFGDKIGHSMAHRQTDRPALKVKVVLPHFKDYVEQP